MTARRLNNAAEREEKAELFVTVPVVHYFLAGSRVGSNLSRIVMLYGFILRSITSPASGTEALQQPCWGGPDPPRQF